MHSVFLSALSLVRQDLCYPCRLEGVVTKSVSEVSWNQSVFAGIERLCEMHAIQAATSKSLGFVEGEDVCYFRWCKNKQGDNRIWCAKHDSLYLKTIKESNSPGISTFLRQLWVDARGLAPESLYSRLGIAHGLCCSGASTFKEGFWVRFGMLLGLDIFEYHVEPFEDLYIIQRTKASYPKDFTTSKVWNLVVCGRWALVDDRPGYQGIRIKPKLRTYASASLAEEHARRLQRGLPLWLSGSLVYRFATLSLMSIAAYFAFALWLQSQV